MVINAPTGSILNPHTYSLYNPRISNGLSLLRYWNACIFICKKKWNAVFFFYKCSPIVLYSTYHYACVNNVCQWNASHSLRLGSKSWPGAMIYCKIPNNQRFLLREHSYTTSDFQVGCARIFGHTRTHIAHILIVCGAHTRTPVFAPAHAPVLANLKKNKY